MRQRTSNATFDYDYEYELESLLTKFKHVPSLMHGSLSQK